MPYYGPARTGLLEFAHLGVRSLNQPAPACRNWAFASLQTSLPTSGVRFQFCKFALRRLAGGAPGIYPLHSCANLLQFLSGLTKSAFLLRKPPLFATMIRWSYIQIFLFWQFQTFWSKKSSCCFGYWQCLVSFCQQMGIFPIWISENKFKTEIFSKLSNFCQDSVLDYVLPIRRHLNTTTFNQAKLIRKWGGKKERAQLFCEGTVD